MILENVTKRYKNMVALDGLTVELQDGAITAVLGESGAGKTTLLNVISGSTSYEGAIDGKTGEHPVIRTGCSYLLQDCCLLPNLTAEENLKFVLPKEEWKNISSMLDRVGLRGKATSRPRELSGGEKRRVAIARAFLYPHDLLLMDEPFSSLDLALKKSLLELVYELWKESGGSVIFVTHDVREAALLAQRALVLKRGKLVGDIAISSPQPRDFFSPPAEERELVRILTE